MNKLIVSILFLSAVLFACKGTQKADSSKQATDIQAQQKSAHQLFGTKWKLISLNGTPVQISETMESPWILLDSTENRINGLGGCNHFFGELTHTGSEIGFSNVGATKMACPNLEMESTFFQMLEYTRRYAFNQAMQLEFSDANNQVLGIFEAISHSEEQE